MVIVTVRRSTVGQYSKQTNKVKLHVVGTVVRLENMEQRGVIHHQGVNDTAV